MYYITLTHQFQLSAERTELSFTEMNGKNITISAGMAFAPEHGTGYLDLYKNADTALYKTKQNGRDGYNIYEEEKR